MELSLSDVVCKPDRALRVVGDSNVSATTDRMDGLWGNSVRALMRTHHHCRPRVGYIDTLAPYPRDPRDPHTDLPRQNRTLNCRTVVIQRVGPLMTAVQDGVSKMSVQSTNKNLPAQLSDGIDHILKQTARSNPLLRFRKGKYFIGDDEVPLGREYIAYALDWTRGWVKWQQGVIVADRLGRVADGFVPPEREELGDNEGGKWEGGNDPWVLQNILPLEDAATGEFLLFVSSSFGGKLAIEKLCNRVARSQSRPRSRIAAHKARRRRIQHQELRRGAAA